MHLENVQYNQHTKAMEELTQAAANASTTHNKMEVMMAEGQRLEVVNGELTTQVSELQANELALQQAKDFYAEEYHKAQEMLKVGSTERAANLTQIQDELKMAQARVDRAESLGMEALQQRDDNYQAWECSENVVVNLQRAMVLNAEEMAHEFGQEMQ